jgi:anthranilate/para-aminobenzoate synthase component II
MKIKELLAQFKQALPYIGFSLGVQNFLMAREAKAARLETTLNETTKLLAELKAKHEVIIAKQATQNKIAGLSADASDHLESSKYHSRFIDELVERLKNDSNINQKEHDFIIDLIQSNTEKKIESLEKANSILREINELIFFSNSPINNYIDQLKI